MFRASLRGDVPDFQGFLLSVDGKLEILKEIATAESKISSRFDYFAWSMRWGNVSIESDL